MMPDLRWAGPSNELVGNEMLVGRVRSAFVIKV